MNQINFIEGIQKDPALIGFLTSVVFLTGLFVYGFFYILRRQWEVQKKERDLEKATTQTITAAQRHAEGIIAQASRNAQELLIHTESFKKNLETDLQNSLNAEMNHYKELLNDKLGSILSNYQNVLVQTGNLYAQSIKQAMQELKENQQKNTESFKTILADETLTAKFYIQRKVNEEIDKAKKEIEDYKENERKKAEKSIRNLILSLSEDIFEGSLTIDQQEKLIFKALEEAQKNKVLDV